MVTECGTTLLERTRGIVAPYAGREGMLVHALQDVQGVFGYLPEDALRVLAEELGVSLSHIWGVASFYDRFHFIRRGRNTVRVCTGTACQVQGSRNVLQQVEKLLGLRNGETSPDFSFTLETVNCVGCCGLAPVVTVNNEVVPAPEMERVLADLRKGNGGND
ncbi:MAG: NAD(P)H-dependent oxidoreductase subunit E [Thermoanaerobacterales bacterium]|nr:NAD(P)H-dependent oxidoreductase subunit E [Thermoanaerobacterales bacterium]